MGEDERYVSSDQGLFLQFQGFTESQEHSAFGIRVKVKGFILWLFNPGICGSDDPEAVVYRFLQ